MNQIPSNYMGNFKGYSIFVSDKAGKKYYAIVDTKNKPLKIYFGDTNYQHYYDKMGYYKNMNHLDAKRRKNYISRHKHDSRLRGSAGWFAKNILW